VNTPSGELLNGLALKRTAPKYLQQVMSGLCQEIYVTGLLKGGLFC